MAQPLNMWYPVGTLLRVVLGDRPLGPWAQGPYSRAAHGETHAQPVRAVPQPQPLGLGVPPIPGTPIPYEAVQITPYPSPQGLGVPPKGGT